MSQLFRNVKYPPLGSDESGRKPVTHTACPSLATAVGGGLRTRPYAHPEGVPQLSGPFDTAGSEKTGSVIAAGRPSFRAASRAAAPPPGALKVRQSEAVT